MASMRSPIRYPGLRAGAVVAPAVLLAAAVQLAAFWPGIMVWDAIRQYRQALSGRFDDWHPPAMNWLWRQLLVLETGPGPMLAVQVVLYWGGLGLLAAAALRRGRAGLAVAIGGCGLLPIQLVLVGTVLKDSLMAGLLLLAAGLVALRRRDDRLLRTIAAALLVAAATLRFNAVPACLPLMLALLPAGWRRTPARLGLAALAVAAPLLLAMPVANRLLHAAPSGVELSLVIYDLGGITRRSGVDMLPPVAVADPVAVNARCYSPVSWDSYAWWGEEPCAIGFDNVRGWFAATRTNPYGWWARAVAGHPIAYAGHRLAHFARNTRLVPGDPVLPPLSLRSDPNPWGFQVPPSRLRTLLGAVAGRSLATPLGSPLCWIALGIGVLILGGGGGDGGGDGGRGGGDAAAPILWSALLYALSYLPLSVASEVRYHFWTMTGIALALVMMLDRRRTATAPRWRLVAALVPIGTVLLLGATLGS